MARIMRQPLARPRGLVRVRVLPGHLADRQGDYQGMALALSRRTRPRLGTQDAEGEWVTAMGEGYSELANQRISAANGIHYAYRDSGGGSDGGVPLVLLQHFRGNLDNWDPALIDALTSTRRVVTFDNAGVGSSTGTTPDTIEQMARDAIAFITAMQFGQADLLGFSIGSFVAQQIALIRPTIVRSLVLAAAAPQGAAGMHGWTPEVIGAIGTPHTSPEAYLEVFFARSAASQQAGQETLRRMYTRTGDRDIATSWATREAQYDAVCPWGIPDHGRLQRLSCLQMPVFVANGDSDPADMIAAAFDQAEARDPQHYRTWVVLVDGACHQLDLIRSEAQRRGVTIHIVIDLIHVLEYIWKAAWSLHAAGDPAAEDWVAVKTLAVLAGHSARAAAEISAEADAAGLTGTQRTGSDACVRYLTSKDEYLRYDQALTAGWPIATGVIEGACRHLIGDRLDITGARWGLRGAEAILTLRAVIANGDFDDYWHYHLARGHQRLYPGTTQGEYTLGA
jgi:pimeloyl-ACP methyl ester carboxylesterase